MAVTKAEEEALKDLAGEPPPTFNADYAKLLLAMRESERQAKLANKSWVDRGVTIVALVTSGIGALTAGVTLALTAADRKDKADEQVFNNQVAVTKIYFDHMAGNAQAANCHDAKLYSKASLAIAKLSSEDAQTAYGSKKDPNSRDDKHDGVQRLALVIYDDMSDRYGTCDVVVVATTAPTGKDKVADAQPTSPNDGTSYNNAPRQPDTTAGKSLTVYIQYQSGSADALATATGLKDRLSKVGGYSVQKLDAVQQAPKHNQVRIYHRADSAAATALIGTGAFKDAQIVNLDTAYQNLPNNVVEVWVGGGAPSPTATSPG